MDDQKESKIIKDVLKVIVPLWFLLAGGGCLGYYFFGSDSDARTIISKGGKDSSTTETSNVKKYAEEGMNIVKGIYAAGSKETLPSSTDGCNGYYYLVEVEDGQYDFATNSDGTLLCPSDNSSYENVRKSCLNENKSYCVVDGTDYFRFAHIEFSDTGADVSVFAGSTKETTSSNDSAYVYKFTTEAEENDSTIAQTEDKTEEKVEEETEKKEEEPVTSDEPIATVIPTEPKPTLVQHTVGVKVSNGTNVNSKLITDGDNAIFTISPNSGYRYKTVTCDGVYGDTSYDTKSSTLYVNSVKGDVSCSLSFINSKAYSVSAVSSLDSEGIVVNGSADVEHGDSVTFTLKPAKNYYPYSNDCGQKMTHDTITIENVTGDVKCTVNFAEINAVLPVQIYYNTYEVKDGVETQTSRNILAGTGEVEYSKAVNYSASVSIDAAPFDPSYTFTGVYCTYATVELSGTTFTVKPYMYGTGVYRCYASFYRYL